MVKEGLRRRFGLSLQWFNVVRDRSQCIIQDWLDDVRVYLNTKALEDTKGEDDDTVEVDVEDSQANHHVRPSEYLRRRCAMCFGGDWSTKSNQLVIYSVLPKHQTYIVS